MSSRTPTAIRRRVHSILVVATDGDPISRWFDRILLTLIVLNVAAVVAASVQSLAFSYSDFFLSFELFSVGFFSIEYLLRVWTCVEDPRYRHPVFGRLRYMITPMAIVDLLAVLPFFIASITTDLRVLRILRIFRLLRIAKVARYSRTLQIFGRVLVATRTQLLFTLFLMIVLLLVASTLMYFVENSAQPDAFSSIPATMWCAIATLTTVGYGDIYPVTSLGKMLGSFIAIFGIGMFALPTGVLGAAFLNEIRSESESQACPHCGKPISHALNEEES